uniref:Immunoglobulin domain-containing protein n=1 Tax=Cyprinus carpio TaxID=7962 RepID=A0A8C1T7G8_CYPCA
TAHIFTVTITDLRTEDQVSRVSGVTGEHLNITCHYENKLKNDVKFICKSSSTSLCEKSATKVSSEINSNGRFSLRDNESAGVFTVTITDLTEEDSGIYWCGAIQRGHGHKNKWISVTDLKISAGKTSSAILYCLVTQKTKSFVLSIEVVKMLNTYHWSHISQ